MHVLPVVQAIRAYFKDNSSKCGKSMKICILVGSIGHGEHFILQHVYFSEIYSKMHVNKDFEKNPDCFNANVTTFLDHRSNNQINNY